jgi:cytochrome c
MRHFLPIVLIAFLTTGCNGDPKEMKREITQSMSNAQARSPQEYYDRSVDLARMNGCWTCHHVDTDVIGPSWRKVSARYKDDPNARARLIEEVKNGSSGKWSDITNGAVMPPNSPRVSDQDIGELVDFILSLAKDKALR